MEITTLSNLVSPPGADNPVTPAQRVGPYPLLANPSGFNSGFNAGNYYGWQTIQMAPETGAVCGNGSPYKFFINRVPNTRNTIVYLEGGGACWDYASCSGQAGIRGARNPDGIATTTCRYSIRGRAWSARSWCACTPGRG